MKRSDDGVRAGDRVGVAARGGVFAGGNAGGRSSWFFGRLAAGDRGGVAALTREDIAVVFMCVRAVGSVWALGLERSAALGYASARRWQVQTKSKSGSRGRPGTRSSRGVRSQQR